MTNAVIKPRIDRLVNQDIAGTLATANGDPILTSIHFSLDEDAHWHREWTAALIRHIVDDNTANAEVVSGSRLADPLAALPSSTVIVDRWS